MGNTANRMAGKPKIPTSKPTLTVLKPLSKVDLVISTFLVASFIFSYKKLASASLL